MENQVYGLPNNADQADQQEGVGVQNEGENPVNEPIIPNHLLVAINNGLGALAASHASLQQLMFEKFASVELNTNQKFQDVNLQFDAVNHEFSTVNHEFSAVNQRFVEIGQKLENVEQKIVLIQQKMNENAVVLQEILETVQDFKVHAVANVVEYKKAVFNFSGERR